MNKNSILCTCMHSTHIWSSAGITVIVAFITMISPLWLPAAVNGSHLTTTSVRVDQEQMSVKWDCSEMIKTCCCWFAVVCKLNTFSSIDSCETVCILFMLALLCLHLSSLYSYCTFKVMDYLYHNVSKSMCLAAMEGTIANKSCVSFWRPLSTFLRWKPVRNTWKNNCGALCFAFISMEIPKLPAYSTLGMCPHPLNFST